MDQNTLSKLHLLSGRLHLMSLAVSTKDAQCATAILEAIMLEGYEGYIAITLDKLRELIAKRNFRSAHLLVNVLSLKVYNNEI